MEISVVVEEFTRTKIRQSFHFVFCLDLAYSHNKAIMGRT